MRRTGVKENIKIKKIEGISTQHQQQQYTLSLLLLRLKKLL